MTDAAKTFAAFKDRWLKIVVSHPNLSGGDISVAVMLAIYCNSKTRDAFPSMRQLAQDVNRDLTTVRRSLKRLESLKLLVVTHARRQHQSNRYRLSFGGNPQPQQPRGAPFQRRQTRPSEWANSPVSVGKLAYRTSQEPPIRRTSDESKARPRKSEDDAPVRSLDNKLAIFERAMKERGLSAEEVQEGIELCQQAVDDPNVALHTFYRASRLLDQYAPEATE